MIIRTVLVAIVLGVLSGPVGALDLEALVCPVRDVRSGDECPCQEDWKPTAEQLEQILKARPEHSPRVLQDPTDASRAILCNTDLQGANLQKTRLRLANLRGANLERANLQGADLSFASLEEADFYGANLQKALLGSAKLQEAYLGVANLRGAHLFSADLQDAFLAGANLQEAVLLHANLQNAELGGAELRGAKLTGANLQDAVLEDANLQDAVLVEADVENARFGFSDLTGAVYAPVSPPPNGYLEGITGLATVTFPPGRQSGLVQLRELLRQAGLRDLEREATFAIEHGKAFHARQNDAFGERLGGWLQLIFFEWTTGWGLHPGRALLIMLGLIVVMAVVYMVPIVTPPSVGSNRAGIFRIRPRERLEPSEAGMAAADDIQVDRLAAGIPGAIAWALYFSLISAFHIGWRDLNVGTWISRLQPTEFALRSRGWVRIVSGVQSLISVYLVAMWVLTYFGRPFQ